MEAPSLAGLGDDGMGAGAGFELVAVIAARAGMPTIPLKSCGTSAHFFHAK